MQIEMKMSFRAIKIAAAVFMAVVASDALADMLVRDSVPLSTSAGGGYTANQSIDGKKPSNTAGEIVGFSSNSYSGGSGVFRAIEDGVSYDPAVQLSAVGGSLAIYNSAYSTGDARYETRELASVLPDSGVWYWSILLKADASTEEKKGPLACLKPGCWYGYGFFNGTERPSTSLTSPGSGIHVGFHRTTTSAQNDETGIELAIKINSTFTTLASDVSGGVTYFVVVKVEKGAGNDGADKVTAVVNPTDVSVFDESAIVVQGDVGTPNRNLIGGAYGTNSMYVRFDEIRVATTLAECCSISDPNAPIPNAPTVTTSSSGGLDFSVSLYKGRGSVYALYGRETDVYTSTNLVAATLAEGDDPVMVSVPEVLDVNASYAYAVMAVGEGGTYTNVVNGGYFYNGVPVISVASNADEHDLRAGEFLFSLPGGVQTYNIDFVYTVSGSAVSGVNFEPVSGVVTLRAGETATHVTVVPLRGAPSSADTDLAVTLAGGGGYRIGSIPPTAAMSVRNYSKADGVIYFMDQFPVAHGDYPGYEEKASISGAHPANQWRIRGYGGNWASSTGVFSIRYPGLDYPANVRLESSGGAFVWHYEGGNGDSRWMSRPLLNPQSSGTVFFSCLMRATDKTFTSLKAGQWQGCGLTPDTSGLQSAHLPTNGVHVGFYKPAGVSQQDTDNVVLAVCAAGATPVPVASAVSGNTYFVVVRIEYGAGAGGVDRATVVVNPRKSSMFADPSSVSVEGEFGCCANFLLGGEYIVGEAGATAIDEILVADRLESVAPMLDSPGLVIIVR